MKALRVHELGEPGRGDAARGRRRYPSPSAGEVRLRVHAAALNFPDVLMCRGEYQVKPPLPFTPGAEVAGVVDALGDGVDRRRGRRTRARDPELRAGRLRRVHDRARGGRSVPDSRFDAVRVGVGAARRVPDRSPRAAPARRVCNRARRCSCTRARAASAARRSNSGSRPGARVIATAGGPEKVEVCSKLGAELAIDYREHDFVDAVKEFTDGRGADVIYDPVGGDTYDRSTKCIAFEGRILIIGFTGGRFAEARTNHVLIKNYSVVGVHWGLYNMMNPAFVRETHDELDATVRGGADRPLDLGDGRPRRRAGARWPGSDRAARTASWSASCERRGDRDYLREVQYRSDDNLAARQSIYVYQQPHVDRLDAVARPRRAVGRRARARRRLRQRRLPRGARARRGHRGLGLRARHVARHARRRRATHSRAPLDGRRRAGRFRFPTRRSTCVLAMHMLYHVPDRAARDLASCAACEARRRRRRSSSRTRVQHLCAARRHRRRRARDGAGIELQRLGRIRGSTSRAAEPELRAVLRRRRAARHAERARRHRRRARRRLRAQHARRLVARANSSRPCSTSRRRVAEIDRARRRVPSAHARRLLRLRAESTR